MPTKILTDQPQSKRRTVTHLCKATWQTVAEPPYFSIPILDADNAVADPADVNRELRAGELFIATGLIVANVTSTAATIEIELVPESGDTAKIASVLTVPGNDVLTLPPGLSLFKRDLGNPASASDVLRARAGTTNALTLLFTVIEREAIDHNPDTEGA